MNGETAGYQGFYTNDVENTPHAFKYMFKSKFQQDLLVWVAISE